MLPPPPEDREPERRTGEPPEPPEPPRGWAEMLAAAFVRAVQAPTRREFWRVLGLAIACTMPVGFALALVLTLKG